jgi:4-hydroxy-2-oxoglutarate aldolase
MKPRLSLSGVHSPICTPFNVDGSVAYDKLKSNLELWCKTPLNGFLVLGSNGEYVYLTEREKIQVLEAARAAIPRDRLYIAGTGCESTSATIALTREAARIGADAAIVVTPNYYKGRMDYAAMVAHYRAVADASPIPVLIYNVPVFTSVDLAADTVATLSRHPNIVGMKDSSGQLVKMSDMIRQADPDFQMLAGSTSFLYPGLCCGAVGGVMALANAAPEACARLYELFVEGKHIEARALHLTLQAPNAAVTGRFGVAGLKYAMELVGFYGGPVRPPLLPATPDAQTAIRAIFAEASLLPR